MTAEGATGASPRRRLLWRVLLSPVLAAALLAVVFFRIDFGEFAHAFSGISAWPLLIAFLLGLVAIVVRAIRWKRLGLAHERATVLDCLSATANGFLVGLAVPGLCEFTRAYVLKRRAQVPFGAVLSVLAVERILDMFLMLVLVLVALLVVPGLQWLQIAAAVAAALLAAVVVLLVVCAITQRRSALLLESVLSRISPRIARRVAHFYDSFASGLRDLRRLRAKDAVVIVLLSALLWLSHALSVYLVFTSFGHRLDLGFDVALFTIAVQYFGMIVPLTPAGLGQYELVVVAALAVFGVTRGLAASVSVVLHGVRLMGTIAVGLTFLPREQVGLSTLAAEHDAADDAPTSSAGGAAK